MATRLFPGALTVLLLALPQGAGAETGPRCAGLSGMEQRFCHRIQRDMRDYVKNIGGRCGTPRVKAMTTILTAPVDVWPYVRPYLQHRSRQAVAFVVRHLNTIGEASRLRKWCATNKPALACTLAARMRPRRASLPRGAWQLYFRRFWSKQKYHGPIGKRGRLKLEGTGRRITGQLCFGKKPCLDVSGALNGQQLRLRIDHPDAPTLVLITGKRGLWGAAHTLEDSWRVTAQRARR